MKKVAIIALAIVAILAIEFYVGFMMGKNSQLVTVKLKNNSHHTIISATLEYDQGNRTVPYIKKGKTKIARFYSGEKNIYRLKVILDNNTTLFSPSRYVSPGAFLVERITDSLVVSER
jgi:hypothetical protein